MVETIGQEVQRAEISLKDYYDKEEARQKQLRQSENHYRGILEQLSNIKDRIGYQYRKAKYDTQMEILAEEVRRILGLAEWDVLQQQRARKTQDLEAKLCV